MAVARNKMSKREPTPVDDVRRVRERLSREAGGDVVVLARQSQKIAEELADSLGLIRVRSPMRRRRVGKTVPSD